MKILFVTRYVPDANGKGSQRRAAQHLQMLAGLGDVTVVLPPDASPIDPSEERRLMAAGAHDLIVRAEPSAAEVSIQAHRRASNRIGRVWRAIRQRYHLDGAAQPIDAARYRSRLAGNFDVVFAFRIEAITWVDSVLPAGPMRPPIGIADFDDIESVKFDGIGVGSPVLSPFWRWKMRRHRQWLIGTERDVPNRWTATLLCSELDAARMRKISGRTPWVVPNALPAVSAIPEQHGDTFRLLFVGTLDYPPNYHGIWWFIDRCWPTVRAALPTAELSIVGYDPPQDLVSLDGTHGLRVVADAPLLQPHYARANLVIVPVHSGSGTRIKVLEAAGHARAIVSTTIGCEGIGLLNGASVQIADEPDDFAAQIIALARDEARRHRLAGNAQLHVTTRFAARTIAADFAARLARLSA